jgi:APA family basic amino acid/polyamine antiporter
VFYYRFKYPKVERPYKTFGYPVVPFVFLVVAGWLIYNTLMTATSSALVGSALILLGLPVYLLFRKQKDV